MRQTPAKEAAAKTGHEDQRERDKPELEPETIDDLDVDDEAADQVRGGPCPHSVGH